MKYYVTVKYSVIRSEYQPVSNCNDTKMPKVDLADWYLRKGGERGGDWVLDR